MIICSELIGFLEGTSDPFVISDTHNQRWVCKAIHHNRRDSYHYFAEKHFFNEFVAGSLAQWLGLPCPKRDIAIINQQIIDKLENEGYFEINKECVAIEYYNEDIKQYPYEKLSIKHRYGYDICNSWLLIENDNKLDRINETSNGEIIFLDFDFGFNGEGWDHSKLEYNFKRLTYPMDEPGLELNKSFFYEWLKRISDFYLTDLDSILAKIPKSVISKIPKDYLKALKELLSDSNQSKFIKKLEENFRREFDFMNCQ